MSFYTDPQPGQIFAGRHQSSFHMQSAKEGASHHAIMFGSSNQQVRRSSRDVTTVLPLCCAPKAPSINTFMQRPGPYGTPWFSSEETLWSLGLIEHGRFNKPDTVLLAFIVDCAMKLYVCASITLHCLESLTDSDLVHTIIEAAYSNVLGQIQRADLMSRQALAFGRFYLKAMADFGKIRERCDITFGQYIQHQQTRNDFAARFLIYDSFGDDELGIIENAFKWVYGQSPSTVVNDMEENITQDSSGRDPISIRQWVFGFN